MNLFNIINRGISHQYKEKLLKTFPNQFSSLDDLNNYSLDFAKQTSRYGEKNYSHIMYKSKDVILLRIPLTNEAPINSFAKHRRERGEKSFYGKPRITTEKESKYIYEIPIIIQAYKINLIKENFSYNPTTIKEIKPKIEQLNQLVIEDKLGQKDEMYFGAHIKNKNKIWFMYLPFKSEESLREFKKETFSLLKKEEKEEVIKKH